MKAVFGMLIGAGIVAAIFGLGGNDSMSHRASSPVARAEAKVEAAAEKQVERVGGSSFDWLVYAACRSPTHCTAELRSLDLPETTLAVDRYRMKGGVAHRVNPSKIEVFLLTNKFANCTGKYLETEDPADLKACSGR